MRRSLIASSLFCAVLWCSRGGRTPLGTLELPFDASLPDGSLPKADGSLPPFDASHDGPQHLDGVIINACSPSDAPSLQVKVGGVGSCDAPVVNPGYFIQMDFWSKLPTGPGAYMLSNALQCVSAECTTATSATLTFTVYSPTGSDAAGTYSLLMPDGQMLTGTFSAFLC